MKKLIVCSALVAAGWFARGVNLSDVKSPVSIGGDVSANGVKFRAEPTRETKRRADAIAKKFGY
jgi:hypothetical protein